MRPLGLFLFALLVLIKPEEFVVVLQAGTIALVLELMFRSLRKMLSA